MKGWECPDWDSEPPPTTPSRPPSWPRNGAPERIMAWLANPTAWRPPADPNVIGATR